jgi:hypothetical protein
MPTTSNATASRRRNPHRLHTRNVKAQINTIADAARVGKLEVNQNGQWGWIEDHTGLSITDAIVDHLTVGVTP